MFVCSFIGDIRVRVPACLTVWPRSRRSRQSARAPSADDDDSATQYAQAQARQTTRCPLHCTHLCRASSVFGQVSQAGRHPSQAGSKKKAGSAAVCSGGDEEGISKAEEEHEYKTTDQLGE